MIAAFACTLDAPLCGPTYIPFPGKVSNRSGFLAKTPAGDSRDEIHHPSPLVARNRSSGTTIRHTQPRASTDGAIPMQRPMCRKARITHTHTNPPHCVPSHPDRHWLHQKRPGASVALRCIAAPMKYGNASRREVVEDGKKFIIYKITFIHIHPIPARDSSGRAKKWTVSTFFPHPCYLMMATRADSIWIRKCTAHRNWL